MAIKLPKAMFVSILVAWLTVGLGNAAQCANITLDGRKLHPRPGLVLRHRRLFVPIALARTIGLVVEWHPGARRAKVGVPDSDHIACFEAGQGAYVIPLERDPRILQKLSRYYPASFMRRRTLMVPLRVLARLFDEQIAVQWDRANRTAHIRRTLRFKAWRAKTGAVSLRQPEDRGTRYL